MIDPDPEDADRPPQAEEESGAGYGNHGGEQPEPDETD